MKDSEIINNRARSSMEKNRNIEFLKVHLFKETWLEVFATIVI